MASSESAAPRVPLSLRVPASVLAAIESYAEARGLSKTDSFLHFLQKGMEAEDLSSQLEGIRSELSALRKAVNRTSVNRSQELRAVRDAIAQSAERFPAIKKAYLFGSFAREDFDEESDIDIRIERDGGARLTLRELAHFADSIERATGRSVDVVSSRTISDPGLAAAIERDKELVYEREAR